MTVDDIEPLVVLNVHSAILIDFHLDNGGLHGPVGNYAADPWDGATGCRGRNIYQLAGKIPIGDKFILLSG